MKNNSLKKSIIIIVTFALLIFVYLAFIKKPDNDKTNFNNINKDNQIIKNQDSNQGDTTNGEKNSTISNGQNVVITTPAQNNFDWNKLTQVELNHVIYYDGDIYDSSSWIGTTPLSVTKVIDLTGDGKPEAIVSRSSFTGIDYVFMRNDDNSITIARKKDKDGTVSPVVLEIRMNDEISSDNELIPEEHGFYNMRFVFDKEKSNSEKKYYKCVKDSVNAYIWNPVEKLFEWDALISEKYTKYTEEKYKLSCI